MSTTEKYPEERVLTPSAPHCENGAPVELIFARDVPLGEGEQAMTVHRTLPQRQRSLVGAWCFTDHYGPDSVFITGGMDVAPHPHMGLQTVSWLFEGEIMHNDSAGYHAVVKPGEVNLMTAGNGICHSETSTQGLKSLHGVQLWVALPDSARTMDRQFENYAPQPVRFDGGEAVVFIGSLLGSDSPVETFTPLLGSEIRLEPGAHLELAVNPQFEHGLLLDSGSVHLEGVSVQRTELAYTGIGSDVLHIENSTEQPARMVLLGGEPFTEQIVMWWNLVARTHEEIAQARAQWQDRSDRFGVVEGYIGHYPSGPAWIPAPDLPQGRIRPRVNPAPMAQPHRA